MVDDSALIRQMLTRALSMDPRIEIVGTAKNGVEAIEKSRELRPDVITLDIEMPELTGLEALPHIQRHSAARIVMLSAVDNPETTYRALELGAIDFIPKPHTGMASSMTELTETLLKKIKTAYRVSPEKAASIAMAHASTANDQDSSAAPVMKGVPLASIVGLAASTGGPPALERVFSGLTADMPAAFLVTQHLPAGFSASLTKRLGAAGGLKTVQAEAGMCVQPGTAYVAPHGSHLLVDRVGDGARLRFSDAAPLHGVRPAADPMLQSLAEQFGDRAIAVVLSGMGTDGALGAVAVKESGGNVIVQDESTSVVWGMPGAAVRLQAAQRTFAIGDIAAEIRRAVRSRAEQDGYR